MKHYDIKECTLKCRSVQHATELASIVTKTSDTHILISAANQCHNCHKNQDIAGRHLLHMAASCGRSELLEWLIKLKKADMEPKTLENGWTPAHCSAFYGHIDCLITLIRLGTNLIKNDYDRLTPLEHLGLDKWQSVPYQPDAADDCDLYSWGSNENFNLGIGHDMKKSVAEVLEYFKKSDISIAQVVMSKFHTVFLSKRGQVYTCGFGIDGRLGHNDELTLISPKLVEALKDLKCIQVAASRDNTYFLMSDGVLYGCGTNKYKQLGIMNTERTLVPKVLNLGKRFKMRKVKHIECAKFHCVILTDSHEVFTLGCNAGQQGHPNEMVENQKTYNNSICYIAEPRSITSLNEPDLKIDLIATSDGCTLAHQASKHILYLFSGYKCRRLFYTNQTNSPFKKLRVHGGKLDTNVCADLKSMENFHDPVLIVGLTESNLLFVWRETEPHWRKITWSSNKKMLIGDFDLNLQGLILCTVQGVCYKAQFSKSKQSKANLQQILTPNTTPTSDLKANTETTINTSRQSPPDLFRSDSQRVEVLDINQIPFVNRCFHVVCDKKARNFFALQYAPTTNMRNYPMLHKTLFAQNMKSYLQENITKKPSNEFGFDSYGLVDPFADQKSHDIELKYGGKVFCLNKFILFSRTPFFDKFKDKLKSGTNQFDLETQLARKYTLQAIEILVEYIYTGQCSSDLIRASLKSAKVSAEASFLKFLSEFKDLMIEKFGFKELKASFEQNAYNRLVKEMNLNAKSHEERLNIMTNILDKLLNDTKFRKKLQFSRTSLPYLHDCQIKCNNNELLSCHRCILVARCDYFQSMLLGCWIESSQAVIDLPFDIDLMQIIVDYLYTDDIKMDFIHSSDNISASIKGKNERELEILFNLYVLSDQLLLDRLKNKCEFKLANLVNLKNIAEVYEFSDMYDAKQLKEFTMEFIVVNLTTLIEAKQLEALSLDLLKDLSSFYRSYFPLVGSRIITPYSDGPEVDSIDLVPMELLQDQRFIEASAEEKATAAKKKNFNSSRETFNEPMSRGSTSPVESSVKPNVPEKMSKAVKTSEIKEVFEKWEKVGKKNRRKISEKEVNIQGINSPKQQTATTPHTSIKSPAAIDSFSENLILNSPKSLEKELKKSPSVESASLTSEWPSLGDMVQIKKKEPLSSETKKKLPKMKANQQKSSLTPKMGVAKPAAGTTGPAWGGIGVTKETTCSEVTSFSLLDVMNEEMKKLKVNGSPNKHVLKKTSATKQAPVRTGWNIPTSQSMNSVPICSIANIMEMETRSKDQYKKLKDRPLNIIQMEEAAIERLQKYYDVENVFDMTIKIELIDEVDFKDYAPIWNKKK